MLNTTVSPSAGIDLKALYKALMLPRTIEEKMLSLLRQGRLSKWFSGYGQEAIAVGAAWALSRRDYILPTHRNLGVWTTREVPLKPLFCQLMGRQGGYTKGRDRTFHFGMPEKRIIGMISHMAAMLPVACGLGLASRLRNEDFVALAFAGDGATREGDFHEALNLAAVWKLPVIFLVENNGYGLSTPTREAIPVADIADAAAGYGIVGEIVDGNDLLSVIDAVRRAADRGRSGRGPTLIEAKTFRMRGHEEASGVKYVPKELLAEWVKKDPVDRFARHLEESGNMAAAEMAVVCRNLEDEIAEAVEYALAQPEVESTVEAERSDLFAGSPPPVNPTGGTQNKRFIDAISEALDQAMAHDDRIVIMGQDIAEYGGAFKVTEGLLTKYGRDRVRNTPIIESGAVGAAMGLALEGIPNVLEMQFADFATCGFNQIVNNLATTHYRWGAPLNVTIRAPFGGSIGAGPFHSQSMEAWFCHVPGLKVVVPSTPEDAKGLLLAAIADPNPVLFLEHKYLYRAVKGDVPERPYRKELGKARLARSGTEATIVTYGIGVHWALEEAGWFREHGREIEIIDLRTLIPWDREAVLASVAKTSRALVLHEAPLTAGFGAEIAAAISEQAFALLDAPVVRVAGEEIPIPFSKTLESQIYSAKSRLRSSITDLLAY
jgi:2-oxoisovalerate dehydrogenase E1 component